MNAKIQVFSQASKCDEALGTKDLQKGRKERKEGRGGREAFYSHRMPLLVTFILLMQRTLPEGEQRKLQANYLILKISELFLHFALEFARCPYRILQINYVDVDVDGVHLL